ncbi:MAG: transposase [Acidobacteriota bacterium]|nr:transposase [Acidobacteriota bacterium]
MTVRATLPDLKTRGTAALRSLILSQQEEILHHRGQLESKSEELVRKDEQLALREAEIERLKLLILKLRRMQFGRKSEKLGQQIEQLELQLENLEASEAKIECEPVTAAPSNAAPKAQPGRGPLPAHLPRETHRHEPAEQSCPDCGGRLRKLGEDVSEM